VDAAASSHLVEPAFAGRPPLAPATLVRAVEDLVRRLTALDFSLAADPWADADVQSVVNEAIDAAMAVLSHEVARASDPAELRAISEHIERTALPLLMTSALLERSRTKPAGYAGDFRTIEMLYTDVAHGSSRLGRFIDRWFRNLAAARAVRNRRPLLARAIRDAALRCAPRPLAVTSLASGPAREIFDVLSAASPPRLNATCVDIDAEALSFVKQRALELGLAQNLKLIRRNLLDVARRGRGDAPAAGQDLVYSVGLIDYFSDAQVVGLLDWIHGLLEPGGSVILGNFDVSNPDRPFMDHVLDWRLFHRSADDLRQLLGRSRFDQARVKVEAEEAGVNLFASCQKPR
jgi:extracellular factor (EF) 3-hydroxypalmitic acid methyl ester biosynthesis protein